MPLAFLSLGYVSKNRTDYPTRIAHSEFSNISPQTKSFSFRFIFLAIQAVVLSFIELRLRNLRNYNVTVFHGIFLQLTALVIVPLPRFWQ
jgi:hypothetical protein